MPTFLETSFVSRNLPTDVPISGGKIIEITIASKSLTMRVPRLYHSYRHRPIIDFFDADD
jgi:hypothetical protein